MNETKARVVATAATLFRSRGVHGTGTLAILQEAGAPRGSLYHHFPGGKAELVLAALEHDGARVTNDLSVLAELDPSPADAVRALAESLAASLEDSEFRLGCPIATAALELAADDEPVQQLCSRTYKEWQAIIAGHFAKHRVRDADGRAEEALCTIEGALVLARSHRDADVVRRAGHRVAAALERRPRRRS